MSLTGGSADISLVSKTIINANLIFFVTMISAYLNLTRERWHMCTHLWAYEMLSWELTVLPSQDFIIYYRLRSRLELLGQCHTERIDSVQNLFEQNRQVTLTALLVITHSQQ